MPRHLGRRSPQRHPGGVRSGLWFQFARIIGEVGPRIVLVENVGALRRRGLDIVLGSLADVGFDAEWLTLRASDVGASHGRKRLFILAVRRDSLVDSVREGRREGLREVRSGRAAAQGSGNTMANSQDDLGRTGICGEKEGIGQEECGRRRPSGCGGELADADSAGQRIVRSAPEQEVRREPHEDGDVPPRDVAHGCGRQNLANTDNGAGCGQPRIELGEHHPEPREGSGTVADSGGARCQGDGPARASRGSEPEPLHRDRAAIPLFAPGPGERDLWEAILADCSELAPSVKPRLRVLANGVGMVVDKGRADQLRCSGNGVVDLQAAVALVELDRRLGSNLVYRGEREA